MNCTDILKKLGVAPDGEPVPFLHEEDGGEYEVWKVVSGGGSYVLKKAKEYELEVYDRFFRGLDRGVPRLCGETKAEGSAWFLTEFFPGDSLCKCSRPALVRALDALVFLQDRFWEDPDRREAAYSYQKSLPDRERRGKYLADPELEGVYRRFLERYAAIPRTLCHDDLLPFNVLDNGERAVLIDWEYAGELPYLTSLARLIAHGVEDPGALFYLTREDRDFAVEYYYRQLPAKKGISYEEYRRDLDLFLFYESCEWVMIWNRYPDDREECRERCGFYLKMARELAQRLR